MIYTHSCRIRAIKYFKLGATFQVYLGKLLQAYGDEELR